MYLKELHSRFKSITWVTTGLVISAFLLGSLAVFALAGSILVACSPSSAIAIINELRAKGPFTQLVLGVKVIMDVVVIILFSVNSSAADALLTRVPFDTTF